MSFLSASVDIWFVHLGMKFSDWSKSFNLFGLNVYYYGVVIACSVLLGLTIACFVAKKTGQKTDTYLDVVIYAVIFGVIGARLYYVIFAWDSYKDNLLEIFNIRNGGLAIYGGVIASVLTVFLYSKKKKLSFGLLADTGCIGLILGQCTGRWSNFINMECFGGYTDGPFAMALNVSKVSLSSITDELWEHSFVEDGITYIQVHPTFLYESLWCLGVLILLLIFTLKKKKKFDGQVFLLYLIGYSAGRFWIEGLRTDQLRSFGGTFAVSQVLALVLAVGALAFMIWKLNQLKQAKAQTETEPEAQPEAQPEEQK